MAMHLRAILFIVTFAYTLPAFSVCDPAILSHVNHRLGYLKPEELGEYVACKTHPNIKNATIIAIASKQKSLQNADDENYNLDVILTDTNSKKILAHRFYGAKLSNGGGPRLLGIEIDTANYFVSPGSRAFGVRARFSMGFTSSEELSLFLINGRYVIEILSGAETHISFTNRGSSCNEKTREARRTLSIDRKITNRFYDLLVTEKLTDSEGQDDLLGGCELGVIDRQTKKYRLKYDGKQYVIPEEMRNFECRLC